MYIPKSLCHLQLTAGATAKKRLRTKSDNRGSCRKKRSRICLRDQTLGLEHTSLSQGTIRMVVLLRHASVSPSLENWPGFKCLPR